VRSSFSRSMSRSKSSLNSYGEEGGCAGTQPKTGADQPGSSCREEERKRLASLPKPKTKEEEVAELRATYESATRQVKMLDLREDAKSDILEHLELKFVDDLMQLMG